MANIDIKSLTPQVRLALLEEIWASLEPETVPVTEAQRKELDRRLADLEADRGNPRRKRGSERDHCCDRMTEQVRFACPDHPDPADCPDALIHYSPRFDEFGIRVHDGGSSVITIEFCPWCGSSLPRSRRDEWFARLEALGIDDPWVSDIPAEFTIDVWYRGSE